MLVHTIALELNQRDLMEGEGRSKKGQRLVLLTASQNKVNTTSMAASGQLFHLSVNVVFQIIQTYSQPNDRLRLRGLSWNKL